MDESQKGIEVGKAQAAEMAHHHQIAKREAERRLSEIEKIHTYVTKRLGRGFYVGKGAATVDISLLVESYQRRDRGSDISYESNHQYRFSLALARNGVELAYYQDDPTPPELLPFINKNLDIGTPDLDRLLGELVGRDGAAAEHYTSILTERDAQRLELGRKTFLEKWWWIGALLVIGYFAIQQ